MYKEFIKSLDFQSNSERRELIVSFLESLKVDYYFQEYSTGKNLIVDFGNSPEKIAIGSHFDRVDVSGGANDNGSAIAVCLDLIRKIVDSGRTDLNLRFFFFDEEESGLKGSKAYVSTYGISDIIGMINLEMVGNGNIMALWPLEKNASGSILNLFETKSQNNNILCLRFEQLVAKIADHLPFKDAGLTNVFSVTCISEDDLNSYKLYREAIMNNSSIEVLNQIIYKSTLFRHYHKPSDTYEVINEESILLTSSLIWQTLLDFYHQDITNEK